MKVLMRVTFGCVLLLAGCRLCWGQDATKPIKATLCDLYQHPEQYTGKLVQVRGTVASNDLWIDTFSEKPCPTYMRVLVVFPDRVKPTPGFDLVRDQSFKEFENAFYHSRPIHI